MRLGSNKQTGFTLLELMVVLAIAGIMAGMAAPFMGEQLAKQRINGEYKSIREAMKLAKSGGQTDKDFTSVVVCPGNEASGCDTSGKWEDGFIAFGDADLDDNYTEAGDGKSGLLAVQEKLSDGTTLKVTDENDNGATVSKIKLTQQGYTADFNADKAPLYLFKYCNTRSTDDTVVRGLVYGPGGIIRMAIDTDDDGIANFDGTNLTCP